MGVSTHVLDAASGRPARDVPVRLEQQTRGGWTVLQDGMTDEDGRISDFGVPTPAGVYRLHFDTARYQGEQAFFPEVAITFRISDEDAQNHVPLLLSPFAYSTYRGS
jgi:5-hydroxyisourate hydrolase